MKKYLLAAMLSLSIGCQSTDFMEVQQELSGSQLAQFIRGRDLFLNEDFGGNGRTCSSCHLRRFVGDNFDITPADAQQIFLEDPNDPLFRSIDSDDGISDYTTLKTHALFRIPFVLPPNVTVEEMDSPMVQENNGQVTVTVLRSSPSIENVAKEESLMWDGREGSNLPHQAISAVRTHFQAGREPTQQESEDIAFFQKQFFTDPAIRIFASTGLEPQLPSVPNWKVGSYWDSVRRGRHFFEDMNVVPEAPVRGGHCATCHSGPMLDTTNQFNPVSPPGLKFANNFVSETNSAHPPFLPSLGNELPELTYHITLQYDVVIPPGIVLFPTGTEFVLKSSDPGMILSTGDPCTLPLACAINSQPQFGLFSTTSFFRTSSLWGSADTAPYFHDNSASSLDEVLEVYDVVFELTAFGTGNPAWILSQPEKEDIKNFMNYAFTRKTPL